MTETILRSIATFAALAVLFGCIGLVADRRPWMAGARLAWRETPVNLIYFFTDTWMLAPALGVLAAALFALMPDFGFWTSGGRVAGSLPLLVQIPIGLYVADFTGYWRHRLLHVPALWPIHAVHHSDRDPTWLTLVRQHPFERLIGILIQLGVLAVFGFAPLVILINAYVRMVYGHFEHMNLPWTYGPLGKVFASPAFHRWHHSEAQAARDKNFSTLFALNDWMFGTLYLPGPCEGPMGPGDSAYPASWHGQMAAPVRHYAAKLRPALFSRRLPS